MTSDEQFVENLNEIDLHALHRLVQILRLFDLPIQREPKRPDTVEELKERVKLEQYRGTPEYHATLACVASGDLQHQVQELKKRHQANTRRI
jgi:hypothetical protein